MPDGKALLFLAPEARTAAEKAREKAKDDVYAFDEDYKQRHLWRVELPAAPSAGAASRPSAGHVSRVTGGDFSVGAFEIARDGRRIVHQRLPNPLFGSSDRGELWLMDADGGHAVAVTSNTIVEAGATLSPDGAQILFTAAANAALEGYHNSKVFAVGAGGGAPRLITPADFPYEVERAEWSRDGRSIYFVANTGVRSQLFVAPAAGGPPDADHQRRPRHPRLALFRGAGRARVRRRRAGERRRSPRPPARRPAGPRHPRLRRSGDAVPPAAGRGDHLDRAGRRDDRRPPLLPAGLRRRRARAAGGADARRAGVVRSLRVRLRGAATRRSWPRGAMRCSSRTTAAAPAMAMRSCATWSATTSRTRTSTSSPGWTPWSPAASPIPIA